MNAYDLLRGVFVPLITPFTRAGGVATAALAALAGDVLSQGAAGLVALGTTAEAATLDSRERQAVVDVCARVCAEREVPLIVGSGGNDTRAAVAGLRVLGQRPG